MEKIEAWNVFEVTGRVDDYLNYRNQSKDEGALRLNQAGEREHGTTNNFNRDGLVSHADWGI